MKKMIKMIKIFIMITITIFISSIPLYAWYTNSISSGDFSITSANVESQIDLYKGIDYDYDGNLNYSLDENYNQREDGIIDVDGTTYYTYNKFLYKMVEAKSAKAEDEYNINLEFAIQDIAPTETHSWLLDITNRGDVNGYTNLTIGNDVYQKYKTILSCFKVNISYYYLDEKNEYDIYIGDSDFDLVLLNGLEIPCFIDNELKLEIAFTLLSYDENKKYY